MKTLRLCLVAFLFCTLSLPLMAQTLGGPFTLTDDKGQTVTDKDFRGKFMLVFFGFATCPDVCPLTLQKVEQALTAFGPKSAQIRPVFITIDPARDTPTKLNAYLKATAPRFTGLTGTQAQIDDVIKKYKVFAQKNPDPNMPDGYSFLHAEYIFVMNPDGGFYSLLQGGYDADHIAKALDTIIK